MKLLVANRGEIAVRVIRACRELGLQSVAVFSDADRAALHVRLADEAHHLGPSPAVESYLRIDRLIDVARRSGARLVHPGYGFLAENAAFARACRDAGLTFVGPPPEAIALMGGKTSARHLATACGVPVVPGTRDPLPGDAGDDRLAEAASAVGYPLLVKAVACGGGKGMRVVEHPDALPTSVRLARSEARSAFGDDAVYFERRIVAPRHIEVQVLADDRGTVVPFVERECSIQRRHQKVVEESPSLAVHEELRRQLADAAVRITRAAGYVNAGTLEFLLDATGRFYFLEMNTRLQVEHPVTEAVTGIDLVQWQLRIAQGEPLSVPPEQALRPNGHAIECRIYAEDPDRNFVPSPGLVRELAVPGGPGVRDDRGVAAGFEVPVFYDSLISKLIVWGGSREAAVARLARALDEYRVVGLHTTLPFFRWLVREPDFMAGRFSTSYLDEILSSRTAPFAAATDRDEEDAAIAAAVAAWLRAREAAGRPPAVAGAWRQAARLDSLR